MGRRSRKRGRPDGDGAPTATREEGRAELPSRAVRDAERRRLRAQGGRSRSASGSRSSTARRPRRERPQAPWGSFPLSELLVLVALVLVIAGLIIWGRQGLVMLIAGLLLGSLAGLELAVREHFAGYRSHTTLLSGFVGLAAGAVTALAITGPAARVAVALVAAATFAVAFYFLREAFKRRSGGLGFR
jgi:hypothetical protein